MKTLKHILPFLLTSVMLSGAAIAQEGAAPAAAAPAASSSSTAAATPAAASPAASTSATGSSPAAATTGTAETPSAGLTPTTGESDSSFLERVMLAKSKLNADGTEAKPAEEKPIDEKPVIPGEETPGEENKVGEDGEENGEDDGYDPYDTPFEPIAPKVLSDKINANPALKAALDADPELRDTLYAQSRLAAETAEFKQVFANANEAKVAAAGNTEFLNISELVASIQKPEDAQAFYAKLLELSAIHDEFGNPVMHDGKPVADGTVGRMIHHTGALFLNHFEQVARETNNPELTAAVEIMKAEAFGDKSQMSREDFTEEQRATSESLAARESALATQERAAKEEKTAAYEAKIVSGVDAVADSEIAKVLSRTDIDAARHGEIADKIREAAYNLILKNAQFRAEQDLLMRRLPGEQTTKDRIGLGKKWLNVALPIVSKQIIAAEGAKILQRQASRQASQTARQEASRSEAEGSLRTQKPNSTTSGADVMEAATTTLKGKLGRNPSSGELFQEIIRMRQS